MSNTEAVADIVGYLNRGDFGVGDRHHDRPFYIAGDSIHADYAGFRLSSAFQPIVAATNDARQIVAYEALLAVRTARGLLPFGHALSPQSVFALPDCNGEITLLDRLTRTLHTLNFLVQGVPAQLHLNVHSDHLLAVDADHGHVFEQILRQCGLEPDSIVLEISEYGIRDKARLRNAIGNWQSRGYRIAADNFGRGHTQLARVLDLAVDVVKLDRSLLDAAQQHRRGAEALARIAAACAERGVTTIATAVETSAQQLLAEQTGIDYAQGFLWAEPAPYCQPHSEFAATELLVNG